jgi:hypothetical protein
MTLVVIKIVTFMTGMKLELENRKFSFLFILFPFPFVFLLFRFHQMSKCTKHCWH